MRIKWLFGIEGTGAGHSLETKHKKLQCCGSGSRQKFWIRIQPIFIKYGTGIFRNNKKHTLNSIKKKKSNIYLPFSISYYSPTVQTVQNSQFCLSALSLFAESRSGTIIPDPDQGKSSGFMRIRIPNTVKKETFTFFVDASCSFSFASFSPHFFFAILFLFYLKIRPSSQDKNPRRSRHIDLAELSEDSGVSSIFGYT